MKCILSSGGDGSWGCSCGCNIVRLPESPSWECVSSMQYCQTTWESELRACVSSMQYCQTTREPKLRVCKYAILSDYQRVSVESVWLWVQCLKFSIVRLPESKLRVWVVCNIVRQPESLSWECVSSMQYCQTTTLPESLGWECVSSMQYCQTTTVPESLGWECVSCMQY